MAASKKAPKRAPKKESASRRTGRSAASERSAGSGNGARNIYVIRHGGVETGWYLNLQHDGRIHRELFSFSKHGGRDGALEAAVARRDELIAAPESIQHHHGKVKAEDRRLLLNVLAAMQSESARGTETAGGEKTPEGEKTAEPEEELTTKKSSAKKTTTKKRATKATEKATKKSPTRSRCGTERGARRHG